MSQQVKKPQDCKKCQQSNLISFILLKERMIRLFKKKFNNDIYQHESTNTLLEMESSSMVMLRKLLIG